MVRRKSRKVGKRKVKKMKNKNNKTNKVSKSCGRVFKILILYQLPILFMCVVYLTMVIFISQNLFHIL